MAERYVIVEVTPNLHWDLDYVTGYSYRAVSHAYQTRGLPLYLAGKMNEREWGEYGPDYGDGYWQVGVAGNITREVHPEPTCPPDNDPIPF